MKINKKIREELITATKSSKTEYVRIFDEYLRQLKSNKSVEGILEAKRIFLSELVKRIPLGILTCYFCKVHMEYMADIDIGIPNCNLCQYAKGHGICVVITSDYATINRARIVLNGAIEELYYKGEDYNENKI